MRQPSKFIVIYCVIGFLLVTGFYLRMRNYRKSTSRTIDELAYYHLGAKLKNDLKLIEKSKSELVNVTYLNKKRFPCIIINNLDLSYVKSNQCPLSIGYNSVKEIKENEESILEGISLGSRIGKKLQIRNESSLETFSRRSVGKIDKRLLHEIGIQNENIFYNERLTKYKKINLHISVDASSSMRGSKWYKTIKLTAALAKSFSMLNDVKLTISFRTTVVDKPCLIFAYNSETDKISKIKSVFKYLLPSGLTPEGLTYEALLKKINVENDDFNNYFINISDGYPYCKLKLDNYKLMYGGLNARKHTKNQVSKMKNLGYNVVSYFVSNYFITPENEKFFREMYGEDSSFIDLENFNQISNVINSKLLESYVC